MANLRLLQAGGVLLASLCLLVPFIGDSNYLMVSLTLAAIFAIAVVGYDIMIGYAGLLALSQPAFMGLGAYTSALLMMHTGADGLLTLLAGGIVAGLSALLIGLITLRLKGLYFAIATLSFNLIVVTLFELFSSITGGHGGLTGIPSLTLFGMTLGRTGFYYFSVLLLAAVILVLHRLLRGMWGRRFKAVHSAEEGAESLGVPTFRTKVAAFVISAIPAGIAGGMMAHYLRFISPADFSIHALITLLLMMFLGGRGTLIGAVLGSLLIRFLPLILGELEQYSTFLYGLIFVLVLCFLPHGLVSLWPRLVGRISVRVAATDRPRNSGIIPFPAEGLVQRTRQAAPFQLGLDGLTKKFGGIIAVEQVSMHFDKPGIYGIIGPNGAGKSTLFAMMAGSLKRTSGQITYNGIDIGTNPIPHQLVAHGLIRTHQTPRLFTNLTVLENVLVGQENGRGQQRADREAAMHLLSTVGLQELADQSVQVLTAGQMRLLELCRVLATQPGILLLDEPAAGLTAQEKEELKEFLARLQQAHALCIVVVEHDMAFVMALCERIYVLNQGKLIAEGTPAEIQQNETVIAAYLGTPITQDAGKPTSGGLSVVNPFQTGGMPSGTHGHSH